MMTKFLTIIRHAESVSNAGHRSADPESIELTERGWQQAKAAAARIRGRPDLIVVSRMLRARQSVEPLTRRFPDVPVEVWAVHEFVFINMQNEAPRSREERKPLVDAYWQRRNPQEMNPCAESFEVFWDRVVSFHARVFSHPAEHLVVVSHGFFMQAFAWGLSHGFPCCTPEMMEAVYEELVRNPVPNSALIRFELSIKDSDHGR